MKKKIIILPKQIIKLKSKDDPKHPRLISDSMSPDAAFNKMIFKNEVNIDEVTEEATVESIVSNTPETTINDETKVVDLGIQQPLVSVIVPVYNTPGEFLDVCFNSIINQTFQQFEVIVINDGSSNRETISKLTAWSRNSKFKIINLDKNYGLSSALNAGIDACSAEYIARMDSDDEMMPTRLEKQYSYMKAHLNVDALGTQIIFFNEMEGFKTDHPEVIDDMVVQRKSWFINHPTVMFKKSKVVAAGKYQLTNGSPEDYDLWIRMYAKKCNFRNLDEILLRYRCHTNQLSRTFRGQTHKLCQAIRNKYLPHLR